MATKLVPLMGLPKAAHAQADIEVYRAVQSALIGRLGGVDVKGAVAWACGLDGIPLDRLPRYPLLEHRLSDAMAARTPIDAFSPRTPAEISSLDDAIDILKRGLAGRPEGFTAALGELHRLACGGHGLVRACGVQSLPDRLGSYVIFPHFRNIERTMSDLHYFIDENIFNNTLWSAAISMTSICNVHPFEDGNGRLSRIVFNAVLRIGGLNLPYIPLHELGRISRGSFLIAMRMAQYGNDWRALANFLDASSVVLGSIIRGDDLSKLRAI